VEKQIFKLPTWVIVLYGISSLVLIPWTYNLAKNLPTFQLAHHWDLVWTGFDIFMVVLLIATTYLAIRRSIWLAVTATSLSTILVVDAWFDVLTSNAGKDQLIALGFAAFIELPLSVFTYLLAHNSILHLHLKLQTLNESSNVPVSVLPEQTDASLKDLKSAE
jgi:hypothetical protein